MRCLRVFAYLLDYPTPGLVADCEALLAYLVDLPLTQAQQQGLTDFVQSRCAGDLLAWQADYDGLFERGRALSLHLFEHVHGESRDRGQAMVDLLAQYRAAGLELAAKELPDYLPLYLEFLSTQGEDNARLGLEEVAHVLGLLTVRLRQRGSDYAPLMETLLALSGARVDLADLQQQLAGEIPDHTPAALDKVWEEEAVSFAADKAGEACDINRRPLPSQRRDQEQRLVLR